MKNLKRNKAGNNHMKQSIRIEFTNESASVVAIAGTFNDWHPDATQMVRVSDGHWVKDLVLPPGRYEYRLVVDGSWMPHPSAQETEPNPFGGRNSVLTVSPLPENPE